MPRVEACPRLMSRNETLGLTDNHTIVVSMITVVVVGIAVVMCMVLIVVVLEAVIVFAADVEISVVLRLVMAMVGWVLTVVIL